MADLDAWAASVAGRYIDVDGWAGAQCWDLSQHWLTTCNGGTLWTQPSRYPGMAAGSWEVAMSNSQDLLRHVSAHPGTDLGQPGDIIIWAYGAPDYPISHTAVLIEDHGVTLYTLSQNSSPARPDLPGYSVESSGPTIYQELPRAGILGFLRPRANITGQSNNITPIPEKDEFDMATVSEVVNALLDTQVPKSNGKGTISLRTFLMYSDGNFENIKLKVADINTASGPVSLRQMAADGARAAQAAAANTAPINRGGKQVSVRQEIADIKTSQIKTEPIIVDIANTITAPDVDK